MELSFGLPLRWEAHVWEAVSPHSLDGILFSQKFSKENGFYFKHTKNCCISFTSYFCRRYFQKKNFFWKPQVPVRGSPLRRYTVNVALVTSTSNGPNSTSRGSWKLGKKLVRGVFTPFRVLQEKRTFTNVFSSRG